MVYKLGFDVLQLLLPTTCLLCNAPTINRLSLCTECIDDLPRPGISCNVCNVPIGIPGTCGQCLLQKPAYDSANAALAYAPPVSQLVQRLKYGNRIDIARLFATLMLPVMSSLDDPPDILVPVPLHYTRLRRRGYNQAWEITRRLAGLSNAPADNTLLQRIRPTPSQTGLSARQRKRNLRDAFKVRQDTGALHIAIVDDVMTTGSTLQAIAEVLTNSGAKKVTGLVVARANKHL